MGTINNENNAAYNNCLDLQHHILQLDSPLKKLEKHTTALHKDLC